MKHLILDVGGVLVYPRMGDWVTPLRAAEILGDRAASLNTERYARARREALHWLDESQSVPSLEDEFRLRRGYICQLNGLMDWGLSPEEIDRLADDFTYNADRFGFFDDVRPWLTRWRERYSLGVLSDAMPSTLLFLEQYGIRELFDAAVISSHVGATKPDPRIYRAVVDALNAEAGDCLFVDDRAGNLEAALAVGMRGVQMSRPEFPADTLWDGPVVHGFESLNQLLETGAPL